MYDYIVDIVFKMKPPVDVKYDSEKRLKWRLQKSYRPYKTRNVRI